MQTNDLKRDPEQNESNQPRVGVSMGELGERGQRVWHNCSRQCIYKERQSPFTYALLMDGKAPTDMPLKNIPLSPSAHSFDLQIETLFKK